MAIMSLHAIPYQQLLQIHQKFLKPSKGKLKVKRNFQRRKSENKLDKWVVVASRVTVSVDAITSAFYTKFMQPVKVSQQNCSHFFQAWQGSEWKYNWENIKTNEKFKKGAAAG